MMPSHPVADLGWRRVAITFVITLVVCNLLGKGFVYLHQHFEVPAITAMLHQYLHPLRDILIACIVTGTVIWIIRTNVVGGCCLRMNSCVQKTLSISTKR